MEESSRELELSYMRGQALLNQDTAATDKGGGDPKVAAGCTLSALSVETEMGRQMPGVAMQMAGAVPHGAFRGNVVAGDGADGDARQRQAASRSVTLNALQSAPCGPSPLFLTNGHAPCGAPGAVGRPLERAAADAGGSRAALGGATLDDVLVLVLPFLDFASTLRLSLACKAGRAAALAARLLEVRVMTWNARSNSGEHKFTETRVGSVQRHQLWFSPDGEPGRLEVAAAVIRREDPALIALQEDTEEMVDSLIKELNGTKGGRRYGRYPEAGCGRRSLDEAELVEHPPGCRMPPLPEGGAKRYTGAEWELNSVLYDRALFFPLAAGRFIWRDGKDEKEHNGRVAVRTLTWTLLRPTRQVQRPAPPVLFCSTHLEAGHSTAGSGPTGARAKLRSVLVVQECIRRLLLGQAKGLARLPPEDLPDPRTLIFVSGDFNMQKTSFTFRVLHCENMRSYDGGGGVFDENGLDVHGIAFPPDERFSLRDTFYAWMEDVRDKLQWRCTHTRRGVEEVPLSKDQRKQENVGMGAVDDKHDFWRYDDTPRETHNTQRTGGHSGSTWHDFQGRRRAQQISEAMAKQSRHQTANPRGAVGHQRHIDHIAFGRNARDRIFVRQCHVALHISSAHLARTPWRVPRACLGCSQCLGRGVFASDHFPVLADVTICLARPDELIALPAADNEPDSWDERYPTSDDGY